MGQADAAGPRPGSSGNEKGPRVLEICVLRCCGLHRPSVSGNCWCAASGTCMLLLGGGVHEAELATHHPMALMSRRASRGAQSAVRPPQGPRRGRFDAVSAAILPYGGHHAFNPNVEVVGIEPPSPACLLSTPSGSDCSVFAPLRPFNAQGTCQLCCVTFYVEPTSPSLLCITQEHCPGGRAS